LPAEITNAVQKGSETLVRVEFRGLSVQVVELLEKLIFRHHRRLVAEARAARPTPT
jgi:hypothetical protein